MPDASAPDPLVLDPADVPAEGALGLLAIGYRGLDAWRAARGTDWVADRQREWEAYRDRVAEEEAVAKAAEAMKPRNPEGPATP